MKVFRRSLAARISAAMVAIGLTALISIGASVFVAESASGDAAALNMAGSLRMQSYKLALALQQYQQTPTAEHAAALNTETADFERRLLGPVLRKAIPRAPEHELRLQHDLLIRYWTTQMRPHLTQIPDTNMALLALQQALETQVEEIEILVSLLEHSTESKIKLLSLIQSLCLVLIGAAILIALLDIKLNIVGPLRRLLELAKGAARQDFSQRAHMQGKDELSVLGQAFDRMAAELSSRYASLEAKAARKTEELERSHQALQLLHQASRALYDNSGDFCRNTVPLLKELEDLLQIGPVRFHLRDQDGDEQVLVAATVTQERPAYCRDADCDACLISAQTPEITARITSGLNRRLLLPVQAGADAQGVRRTLGTLEIWHPKDRVLEEPAHRLLETLADQLATAVFIQRRITEQQQLSLMEERTIIARELHDSLAQSLSYLKIQVSRLQKMHGKNVGAAQQAEVLDELRNGLNSAYRQLRELLTTFRLKLDSGGLQQALIRTVTELSRRGDSHLQEPISLYCELPAQLLTPHEEIHVLQIVREALTNAIKHSQATHIEVRVEHQAAKVVIRVLDNGIGLPEGRVPDQHYGLIIMRDRSQTLGGEISIRNRDQGGVEVDLVFLPQRAGVISLAS